MSHCSQCGAAHPEAERSSRKKLRLKLCEPCAKERKRNKYNERGVRDRLRRSLRRYPDAMDDALCTPAFVARVLARWHNCCVISGQTVLSQLDIVPYHGFKKDMGAVPEHEWIVLSVGQNKTLARARDADQRMARLPEAVHQAILNG
jgi:hypothetical protein